MAETETGDHVVADSFDFPPLFVPEQRMLAMALADESSQQPTPTVKDTTMAYDMASTSNARKLTPKRRKI
uniref:Uncharacterized protein n=1 Tax=Aegilops tauschii TaxID=37682 RepID=M8CAH9_AEGTA